MGLLRRPPAEVRAAVPSGERVLAWGTVAPGGVAVATDAALYLPLGDAGARQVGQAAPAGLRLAWDLISKATFSEAAVLVVEGRPEPNARDRAWRVVLEDPGALPTVVYERVTSSVVVSERVALRGELGARIVARRAGEGLRWTVTFDAGLDPRDPVLRAEADEALAELRATLGV
ncbi:MAG: hypothetical protein RLZ94_1086 [Actinomycetota bacterium]